MSESYNYPEGLNFELMKRKFKFKELRKDSGLYNYLHGMSFPNEHVVINNFIKEILDNNDIHYSHAPASIYEPKQLWDAFAQFCEPSQFVRDDYVNRAIDQAFSTFGKPKDEFALEYLQTEDSLKFALQLDTSAGIYMGSKSKNWELGYANFLKLVQDKRKPDPCIPVRRTQRGEPVEFGQWLDYKGKSRLAYAFPITQLLLEGMVAYPIIQRFKERVSPIPWAWKRKVLGVKLVYAGRGMRSSVGLDFSRFDASVPAQLIRVAFDILKTWVPHFPLWDKISNYFINTPMVPVLLVLPLNIHVLVLEY